MDVVQPPRIMADFEPRFDFADIRKEQDLNAMTKKKNKPLRVIRKSCITGKAVWVSHCTNYPAVWLAYMTACKREVERVKNLGEKVAHRKANILKFLNDCLAGLPIEAALTSVQKTAARQLLSMADSNSFAKSEFYEHIMEERRRREEDREMWRKRRESEKATNSDYDK